MIYIILGQYMNGTFHIADNDQEIETLDRGMRHVKASILKEVTEMFINFQGIKIIL